MLKGNIAVSASRKIFLSFLLLLLIALEFLSAVRADAQPSSELKLIGTIRSSSFSGAVFSDSAGLQTFFRINTPLPDGSRLVQVSSKSILLKNTDGSQYELFISQDLKTAGMAAPPPKSIEPLTQEESAPKKRRNTQRHANKAQQEESTPKE